MQTETLHGTTKLHVARKGWCQDCILLPYFLNLYVSIS